MMNAIRSSKLAVITAVSRLSSTITTATAARIRRLRMNGVMPSAGANAQRGGERGRDPEPEQAGARLVRCIEPWREHREQREGAVRVVQMVVRAAVVGQEEQAEADLGDEQRLREGEQLCNRTPGSVAASPERRRRREDADRDQEECVQVVGR